MTTNPSPIADAVGFTNEAIQAAQQSQEYGAAFDLRVLGKILEEDVSVHRRVADGIASVIADQRVTQEEIQLLERLAKLARA